MVHTTLSKLTQSDAQVKTKVKKEKGNSYVNKDREVQDIEIQVNKDREVQDIEILVNKDRVVYINKDPGQ